MPSPRHVVVGAVGAPGHLFPLIPLARSLHAAGHRVTIATHHSARDAVRAAGLEWVAAGLNMHDAFRRAAHDQGDGHSRDRDQAADLVGRAFGDILARSVAEDLTPWLQYHRPDLVIAETGCPGAALAAQAAAVPYALHGIGRRIDPAGPMSTAITARLRTLGEALGVDDQPHVEHAHLDICPPSLQRPIARSGVRELALRPTMWNPATAFTDRRSKLGGRPWVYLTLGTAGGDETTLRAAANGLTSLDVDVLLAAGTVGVEPLRDLERTPRVQVEAFVPAAELMNRFDLVVHHGGSATALGAAAAGTPQILLPWGADQFDNAAALEATGAGVAILAAAPEVIGEQIASAAAAMQSTTARSAVRTLAAEIAAMPGPTEIAARLEQWR